MGRRRVVVDTALIYDLTWIRYDGHPHSDALHIVERMKRIAHDILQIDFTFDDPKAYNEALNGKGSFNSPKAPRL